MIDVAISGIGVTKFVKQFPGPVEILGAQAAWDALSDADHPQVTHVVVASSLGGMLVGQRISRHVGLDGSVIINVENACSGGATALAVGRTMILSGEASAVLVVGVDQMSVGGSGPLELNAEDPEAAIGNVMPNTYAMRARRYLDMWGHDEEVLDAVSVKARRHGSLNPKAQFTDAVSTEDVRRSRLVAEPLRLLHCCPKGDGAAAAVLTSGGRARNASPRVRASIVRSGSYDTSSPEMGEAHLTKDVAEEAYKAASLEPTDLHVVELHDAFAIAELMYYEALGICEKGGAPDLLQSGATSLGGQLPVNTGGGLLSRGHPIAATGLAQIAELVTQLRGAAEQRQVDNARFGLAHVTGGGIAGFEHGACSVTILEGRIAIG